MWLYYCIFYCFKALLLIFHLFWRAFAFIDCLIVFFIIFIYLFIYLFLIDQIRTWGNSSNVMRVCKLATPHALQLCHDYINYLAYHLIN